MDQLTTQHDITVRHLTDTHRADIDRIRTGMYIVQQEAITDLKPSPKTPLPSGRYEGLDVGLSHRLL